MDIIDLDDLGDRDMITFMQSIFGRSDWVGQEETGDKLTKAIKVYRIEMPNGHGPYNSGLPNQHEIYTTICAPKPGFDCSRLAQANHENINFTGRAFHKAHGSATYACISLPWLGEWFPKPAREYLRQYEARVVVYEVPVGEYVLELGHGELIFCKDKAKKVEEFDLLSF